MSRDGNYFSKMRFHFLMVPIMIIAHSMHGIQYLRLESCTDRMHIYACLCHVRQYQDFENHGMAWQQKSCSNSLVVGVVDNSPHDFSMKECSRLG